MKRILWLFIMFIWFWFCLWADSYIFYYWNWCAHCLKVEEFFDENKVTSKYNIEFKEIYFDNKNRTDFLNYVNKSWIPSKDQWVPLLVAYESVWESHYIWDKPIIAFFKKKLINDTSIDNSDLTTNVESVVDMNDSQWIWWGFFGVLLPAALADSINPCAFAVMLILMWSILSRYKSYKKLFLSWFLFILAIFISYVAMWLWLYKALASSSNTFYLKLFVWILWVLVGLFNIKDYFWYWKWFVFEVPISWRPKMHSLIKSVVSPIWAFGIGILVSLFLLPCTSWPYITVLWYLASNSSTITSWWLFYLLIYNIIFILPMFVILFIVSLWFKSIDELNRIRNDNIPLIHLIVWLLMLWLWLYVLNDIYSWIVF